MVRRRGPRLTLAEKTELWAGYWTGVGCMYVESLTRRESRGEESARPCRPQPICHAASASPWPMSEAP